MQVSGEKKYLLGHKKYLLLSGLPVQARGAAEGVEAAVVRAGHDQAPAALLRDQGGLPLQGRHRPERGEGSQPARQHPARGAPQTRREVNKACIIIESYSILTSMVTIS